MTLSEMSQTYQDSAAAIHQRIVTLRQQERTQEDPEQAFRLRRRIDELTPLWREARELAALLQSLNCHVNLIPVNPIKERDYVSSGRQTVLNFKNELEKSGIVATIRREMGRDIDGACGQLRKSYMDTKKER